MAKLTETDVRTIRVSPHKNPEDLSTELGVPREWVEEKREELNQEKRIRRMAE